MYADYNPSKSTKKSELQDSNMAESQKDSKEAELENIKLHDREDFFRKPDEAELAAAERRVDRFFTRTEEAGNSVLWYFAWTVFTGIVGVFCTVLGIIFLSITMPHKEVMCDGRGDSLFLAGIIVLPIGSFFLGLMFLPGTYMCRSITEFKSISLTDEKSYNLETCITDLQMSPRNEY